jgi:hypothetical protein
MRRLLLMFLLFASACQPASEKSVTKTLDNPRLFKDGGVLMLLPGVFVRSNFQEVNNLHFEEAPEGPSFIFRDTTDARNTFYFTEAAYLDVEEGMEEKMFSEFESVVTQDCKKIGVTCRLLENDHFLLSNNDRVYKMSYQVAAEYFTTYFVASKTRVVKVIVHNVEDDGETTVRSMNIDPYFYVDPLPAD